MMHVPRPHDDAQQGTTLRDAPRRETSRLPSAVRPVLAVLVAVAVSIGGAVAPASADPPREGDGTCRRRGRAAHEPRPPRLPARRGDAAGGRRRAHDLPARRGADARRCRGPTPTRGPAARSSGSAAAPSTTATGYWGQGAYNADDIARAAVVYLRHWTADRRRDEPRQRLRAAALARVPADDRRPERGQRRAVDAARRHAEPVRGAGRTARPVGLGTELLARPHDLGARRGVRGLPRRRPRVRGVPRGAARTLGRRAGPAGAGELRRVGASRTACAFPRG